MRSNWRSKAGRNLVVQGSEVVAQKGAAQLLAGNDISIVAAVDSTQVRHDKDSNSRSLGGFKASKVTDKVSENRTTAVGSLVSGNSVDVQAGQDGLIRGSSLVSTADITVSAGRDLQIDAAQNTFTRNELHKEKSHDFTGVLTGNSLGIDDMTGNQHLCIGRQNHTGQSPETTLTGSTLGSSAGNVSLSAGLSAQRDCQRSGQYPEHEPDRCQRDHPPVWKARARAAPTRPAAWRWGEYWAARWSIASTPFAAR